jgi:maltooligosyltrehalose trehalohydrolase
MATTQLSVPAQWRLARGVTPYRAGVRVEVWAPHARRMRIRFFTGGARGDHELDRVDDGGRYAGYIDGAAAGDEYMLLLDDKPPLPDPVSRYQPRGVHGPSEVVDPDAFDWTDRGWQGVEMAELVIYELHIGTFTAEGTFAAAIPRLRDLKSLGVTAVEIMPIAQFPGARNWGYDGVGLYAVQNSYGGPNGLKEFVDAAHSVGLGVLLDVVYNHLGPEGNYLDAYGPYFTDKYSTPWGRAFNYDDVDSEEVRRFVIDNALHWIAEYHIDGLRLDAVHGIYDFSARHLLEELTTEARSCAESLGRRVLVIAESDLNDPKLVRPVEEHGFGMAGQWADDFHHAVHALLTGERSGYYADFGGIEHLVRAMREPFVYDGAYSAYRGRPHGRSSAGVPRARFVVATQNHDQVGNRAEGERLCTLVDPARTRLAAALLLTSPYVPLLFMGEEYGENNPFLYFIDHGDSSLVDAVRTGRRREFERFGWDRRVPDPADLGTFQRSKIDWDKRTLGSHPRMLRLFRDLLALRREGRLLRPDEARLSLGSGDGWITLLRTPREPGRSPAWLCVYNCSDRQAKVPIAVPAARAWTLRLSTDAAGYGGDDRIRREVALQRDTESSERPTGAPAPIVSMPAWSAALYRESA